MKDFAHIYRTILRNSKFFDYDDKTIPLSAGFKLEITNILQFDFFSN